MHSKSLQFGSLFMEGGDSVLEAIYEEDDLEDVEMLDIEGEHVDVEEGEHVDVEEGECVGVEEGEFVKENSLSKMEQSSCQGVNIVNQETSSKNRNRFYFAKDSHVLLVCLVLVLYSLFTTNYLLYGKPEFTHSLLWILVENLEF